MRRLLLASLLFCCVPTLNVASAQDTSIVVLPFSGQGAGQARIAVVRALGDYTLIPQRTAVVTARRMQADLSTPAGMAAVAGQLRVTLIVYGSVQGRGANASTTIHVLGEDGTELATAEAPGPVGRARRAEIGRIAAATVTQALAAQTAVVVVADTQDTQDNQGNQDNQDNGSDADQPPPEDGAERHGPAIFGIFVGINGRNRQANINLADNRRQQYDAGLFTELSFRLEARPLGFMDSAVNGLFIEVDGAFALSLSSVEETTGNTVDTTAFRILAALGYLYDLADNGSYVGGTIGFEIDSFDLAANTVLASSSYSQLRFGLLGRIMLIESLLHADLSFGFRTLLGVGDLGPAYGDGAGGFGFDIGASLGGTLDFGLAYALHAAYRHYALSFSGNAAAGAGVDGTDKAVVVGLRVGFVY